MLNASNVARAFQDVPKKPSSITVAELEKLVPSINVKDHYSTFFIDPENLILVFFHGIMFFRMLRNNEVIKRLGLPEEV